MQLFIKDMSEKFAAEIVNWKYDAPYDFYNIEASPESINELIENPYYVIVDQYKELVGFFCTGSSAQVPIGHQYEAYSDEFIDIGIGMKPNLTGQGYGDTFFLIILPFIEKNNFKIPIRLTVAEFNQRAINLYTKHGFIRKKTFLRGSTEFIVMVKEL